MYKVGRGKFALLKNTLSPDTLRRLERRTLVSNNPIKKKDFYDRPKK
jgi:hypothetical protein